MSGDRNRNPEPPPAWAVLLVAELIALAMAGFMLYALLNGGR